MPKKESSVKPQPKAADNSSSTVTYVDTRPESSPFVLKIGSIKVKPILQPNNTHKWTFSTKLIPQAMCHNLFITGRLVLVVEK